LNDARVVRIQLVHYRINFLIREINVVLLLNFFFKVLCKSLTSTEIIDFGLVISVFLEECNVKTLLPYEVREFLNASFGPSLNSPQEFS
jgi:hypothetical protein